MAREKLSVRPNYTKVRPGLRGKTRYDIQISDETTIKANIRVIIQPLNPNLAPNTKQLYKLTTYELDNSKKELPESQRDIIIGSSYEIFIENPLCT